MINGYLTVEIEAPTFEIYIGGAGGGGGGGGTSNYDQLINKPKINGKLLTGDKKAKELGLASITFGGESASLEIDQAEGETVRIYESSEVDDLIGDVRAVKTGTFTPTAGVASSGSVVYTGCVAFATITTGEIPSGVWTTVGTVIPKPRLEVSAVALNGAVVEFGNLRIGVNGDVRVYQRTGTVQQFYGVSATYLI